MSLGGMIFTPSKDFLYFAVSFSEKATIFKNEDSTIFEKSFATFPAEYTKTLY